MDDHIGTALDERFDRLAAVGRHADEVIQKHERNRGDEAAADGIAAAIHRILHGIREDEQQHEFERRELSHLPLACDADEDEQECLHDDPPHDEFPPREAERPHAVRGSGGNLCDCEDGDDEVAHRQKFAPAQGGMPDKLDEKMLTRAPDPTLKIGGCTS